MPTFGKASRMELDTVHPDMVMVCERVILVFDFQVLEGFRGEAKQNEAFKTGHSKAKWGESPHNNIENGKPCSLAVDVAPYPVDWKKLDRFIYLAGHFHMAGDELLRLGLITHRVRWGADWDQDNIPVPEDDDEHFADWGHFELVMP